MYTPVTRALGRLPQKNCHEFKVSQGYITRDFLQNNEKGVIDLGPGTGTRVTTVSEIASPVLRCTN